MRSCELELSTIRLALEPIHARNLVISATTKISREVFVPIQLHSPNPPVRYNEWKGPKLAAAIVAIAGVLATGAVAWTAPSPLVLPILSVMAIVTAGAAAAIAWMTAQRLAATSITYWDIAGALTFIGIFAALLSDAGQALPLLETQQSK